MEITQRVKQSRETCLEEGQTFVNLEGKHEETRELGRRGFHIYEQSSGK